VATVLAIGSGSGSTTASSPSAGPVKVQDTAYIIKRVKARIAEDIEGATVIHSSVYASGDDSDGSLVNLGQKTLDGYGYTAPDGSVSFRNDFYGNPDDITINDLIPDGNGKYDDSRTIIDPGSQTYSQDHFSGLSNPDATAGLNLFSSSSEVQQALQNGQVTQNGTATVNGTHAIVLSVKVPSASSTVGSAPGAHSVSTDLTLYVDALTYQPLRRVLSFGGAPVCWSPTGCRPRRRTSPTPRTTRSPPDTQRSTTTTSPAVTGPRNSSPPSERCGPASATTIWAAGARPAPALVSAIARIAVLLWPAAWRPWSFVSRVLLRRPAAVMGRLLLWRLGR
jgi:hypothetical protein